MDANATTRKDLNLRSGYLNDASRYLLEASLSTSAYIMADNLKISNEKTSHKSLPICSACGTILIPGSTLRRSTVSQRTGLQDHEVPAGSKQRHTTSRLATELVDECLTCRRSTRVSLPNERPARGKKGLTDVPKAKSGDLLSEIESGIRVKTEKSQRKRKKRKDLLSKANDEREVGSLAPSGLNLMDFMKAA